MLTGSKLGISQVWENVLFKRFLTNFSNFYIPNFFWQCDSELPMNACRITVNIDLLSKHQITPT